MKIPIAHIKKNADNVPFKFDEQVDVSELETMNNDIREINSVHVYGTADDQGNDIIFSFSIDGEMVLPCARTLADVPYPFAINALEIFSESPYDIDDEDNDIHPIEGEVLDLTPLIKENILLEVPYRVFSDDEEVISQASFEGEGWEFISEGKREKKTDPRMKKLESLLKDKDKEE
ncbi:YceD family protein [Lentibacillus cibarius]|uniref:DUF177 domain-containing protein n=1 Tax=Lentibacillus cibarius TaxID=2583219 RepID=A0A5S3QNK0_9BACI|nr:YceD family protein [Lentibacillus cibarius]TMN23480.1 hypothetical protein FFL34_16280 [Lentibacillus cibarius]